MSKDITAPFSTSALDGVVSFTPLPVYSKGHSPRFPLDRRLKPKVSLDAVEKRKMELRPSGL
jgi:hypothetical protein